MPIEHFLVIDNGQFPLYTSHCSPPFLDYLKKKNTGEKVVWNHNIYQEIGVASELTVYQEAMVRIQLLFHYIFGLKKVAESPSLTEVLEYLFSPLGRIFTVYRRAQRSLKEIAEEYQQLKKQKAFPDLLITQPLIREGLTMSMKGLELVAKRLSQKSNLSSLIVCESLNAWRIYLKTIADDSKDARYAFVVPCHQFAINPDPCAVVEQHMLSVLVEKVGGKMHVCVLEPMIVSQMNLDIALRLDVDSDHKNSLAFAPDEQVMAFARSVCPSNSTTFYYSVVGRQFGPNGGCSTFALRDAVSFLKNRLFFKEIQTVVLPRGNFQAITVLPPAFMLSTQSIRRIGEYIEQNPPFAQQKLGKRQLTLQEAANRRTYREVLMLPEAPSKLLNKYIDGRTAKYQELLLEMLKAKGSEVEKK